MDKNSKNIKLKEKKEPPTAYSARLKQAVHSLSWTFATFTFLLTVLCLPVGDIQYCVVCAPDLVHHTV